MDEEISWYNMEGVLYRDETVRESGATGSIAAVPSKLLCKHGREVISVH